MNVKKILAGAVASVMALSTMAVVANADAPYTATLGFADGSWSAQDWATTTEVNGDGTYTLTTKFDPWQDEDTGEDIPAEATGIKVFVVDIAQLGADLGLEATDDQPYDMTKCTVSDVKVTADGNEIAVDNSKILWGDPEGKGNLRIEIFNAYGSTSVGEAYDASVSPINPADISAAKEISVTFTLSGIGGDNSSAANEGNAGDGTANDNNTADNGDTNAPTADKNTPDTGVEGVAVVAGLAIVAAGAVVVAKKRK